MTLFALDADTVNSNGHHPHGTPTAAAGDKPGGSSFAAMLLSGQSMGPRGFAAAFGAGTGTPKAAASGTSSAEGLIDSGVLLTGCYDKLQVTLTPGGKHTCRMHALLVQPGLYVLGVADVQQVHSLAIADPGAVSTAAAAAAAGVKAVPGGAKTVADSGAPGRVYFNQDRLYVLVTR